MYVIKAAQRRRAALTRTGIRKPPIRRVRFFSTEPGAHNCKGHAGDFSRMPLLTSFFFLLFVALSVAVVLVFLVCIILCTSKILIHR